MNIVDHVRRMQAEQPDSTAVVTGDEITSYADLAARARRASAALESTGVRRGDVVCLHLANSVEHLCWLLGTLAVGAIASPVSMKLAKDEIAHVKSLARPVVVVTDTPSHWSDQPLPTPARLLSGADPVRELDPAAALGPAWPASMATDDPAFLLFTSGTTGRPKGALLSHGNVVSNMRSKVKAVGLGPGHRVLAALPMYHCFALNAIINPTLEAGATLLLVKDFQRAATVRIMQQHGCTHLLAVPSIFKILLDLGVTPENVPRLEYAMSAGAPLDARIQAVWSERFGFPIAQAYGMTETSPFATYSDGSRLGSVGWPIDGVEVRLVGPQRGDVGPGEVGVIEVRGSNVMLGYWNDPAATAEVLRDGWMHTGDMGRFEADGSLTLVDRSSDVMIVSGQNVYPAEIERVLAHLEGVQDAAAFGRPHDAVGDIVCVDLVMRPGSDVRVEDVRRHCSMYLAGYKVPVQVHQVDHIPRNPTGKIDRRALKARQEGATSRE